MRIVKPASEILQTTLDPLGLLAEAGSTCYTSDPDSNEEFVARVMRKGHELVIEHASATVRIICDRGVSHEIVRHRLASYSQESTRYCNYSKGRFGKQITVIEPCFFPPGSEKYRAWYCACATAEREYFNLLAAGARPEQARSVLPNSLKTETVMTANMREWRHFFKLRTAKAAHPQMREIAIPLLGTFKKFVPVLFEDITC